MQDAARHIDKREIKGDDKDSALIRERLPTRYQIYAELSEYVYDNEAKGIGGRGALREFPEQEWELLCTSLDGGYEDCVGEDYFGAAYRNRQTGEIVIAHRGTDPEKEGARNSDLYFALSREFPPQFRYANNFVNRVLANFRVHDLENVTLTGHSLGGILAQLCACQFGILAVTFDSGGCRETIEQQQRAGHLPRRRSIPIVGFLSHPNVVNTCGRHEGIRIFLPAVSGDDLVAQGQVETVIIDYLKSISSASFPWERHILTPLIRRIAQSFDNSHSIVGFVRAFNNPHIHASRIEEWPATVANYCRYESSNVQLPLHARLLLTGLLVASDAFVGYQTGQALDAITSTRVRRGMPLEEMDHEISTYISQNLGRRRVERESFSLEGVDDGKREKKSPTELSVRRQSQQLYISQPEHVEPIPQFVPPHPYSSPSFVYTAATPSRGGSSRQQAQLSRQYDELEYPEYDQSGRQRQQERGREEFKPPPSEYRHSSNRSSYAQATRATSSSYGEDLSESDDRGRESHERYQQPPEEQQQQYAREDGGEEHGSHHSGDRHSSCQSSYAHATRVPSSYRGQGFNETSDQSPGRHQRYRQPPEKQQQYVRERKREEHSAHPSGHRYSSHHLSYVHAPRVPSSSHHYLDELSDQDQGRYGRYPEQQQHGRERRQREHDPYYLKRRHSDHHLTPHDSHSSFFGDQGAQSRRQREQPRVDGGRHNLKPEHGAEERHTKHRHSRRSPR